MKKTQLDSIKKANRLMEDRRVNDFLKGRENSPNYLAYLALDKINAISSKAKEQGEVFYAEYIKELNQMLSQENMLGSANQQ